MATHPTLNLSIKDSLKAQLDDIAKQQGMPTMTLARIVLQQYANTYKPTPPLITTDHTQLIKEQTNA
jgi:antitoxin component of RelBE/YafQ-DinJ toxin-antitoxin module